MDDKKYIKCRFLDVDGNPKGAAYTYAIKDDVKVGDYVYAMTSNGEKSVVVVEVGLDPNNLGFPVDKIKTVSLMPTDPKNVSA